MFLQVKVIPKAAHDEILGWEDNFLKVRIHAVPEKGQVNERLIAFLAKKLSIPKNSIRIVRGEKSRKKTLEITGLSDEKVFLCLNA